MKHCNTSLTSRLRRCTNAMILLTAFIACGLSARAQSGTVSVDLGVLDGMALTPDNITAFTLQSGLPEPTEAEIKGTLRYRQDGRSLSYTFRTRLQPGLNRIDPGSVRPQYTASNAALKELFLSYKTLPQGTYQYCVSVQPLSSRGEQIAGAVDEQCLINKSEDLFLINLVDPENNAKLYERNPVFSWVVNYPFASQLTYRIRVAEVKQGQNNVTAITRNNPVYAESNLPQTTTTYPVYGKPLELFQPYAWTVDAYFKGMLLGGAEPWRFTIVEDSILNAVPREMSHLDIAKGGNVSQVFALGKLKLKYVLSDLKSDSLQLEYYHDGKVVERGTLLARQGDNRYEIDLYSSYKFAHFKKYNLVISSESGVKFEVSFKYVNPEFL